MYPQASQTVVQGGSALFQCRVTGDPIPTAKWTRVGGGSMPSNVEELVGGVIRSVLFKCCSSSECIIQIPKDIVTLYQQYHINLGIQRSIKSVMKGTTTSIGSGIKRKESIDHN